MAGDWMKIEKSTPDKPEVLAIADSLGIDPCEAFGRLFLVWRWFDDQTVDGNAPSVTKTTLDRYSMRTGFADAMLKVGWLVESQDGITLPNFDRHNGQSSKRRALTAKRAARSKSKSNAPSVTGALPNALPREEKRREENISTASAVDRGGKSRFATPDISEVASYSMAESLPDHSGAFHAYYESNGWRVGKNPMKNWKAAYRGWCSRQGQYSAGQPTRQDTIAEANLIVEEALGANR